MRLFNKDVQFSEFTRSRTEATIKSEERPWLIDPWDPQDFAFVGCRDFANLSNDLKACLWEHARHLSGGFQYTTTAKESERLLLAGFRRFGSYWIREKGDRRWRIVISPPCNRGRGGDYYDRQWCVFRTRCDGSVSSSDRVETLTKVFEFVLE